MHPKLRIVACMLKFVPSFRISQVAELLGVSDDTVRRWVDSGALPASKNEVGRKVIDGVGPLRWFDRLGSTRS